MSYQSTVLADSPLVYPRLGDAALGTTMSDSSGNGRNGTYSTTGMSTTGLLTGDSDAAINISGTNHGTITSASWMNVSSWSVEAWIKPSSVSGNKAIVTRDGNSGSRGWNLYLINNHICADDGTALFLTGSASLLANNIYHVVMTYDGTTVKLYVNGSLDGSTTRTMPASSSNDILIGVSRAGTAGFANAFAGTIDEVAYYSGALTLTQIQSHYNTGTGVSSSAAGSGSISLSGSSSGATQSGSGSLSLSGSAAPAGRASGSGALALSGTGLARELYLTDTTNSHDGLDLVLTASVEFTVPVEAPPETLSLGQRVVKVRAYPVPTMVDGRPTGTWPETRAVTKAAGRKRYLIDGVDVTYFRRTPMLPPRYQLTEPFGYGPTNLQFPQIHAVLEAGDFGTGELSWVRKGAEVRIDRVMPDNSVEEDYVGVVVSVEIAGRVLNLNVGGEFSGRASLQIQHQRAFRYVGDVGHLAALAIGVVGLRPDPWYGPTTGIEMVDTANGESVASWASKVCAMSQDANGVQRAIMPKVWGSPVYTFDQKDYTTKHCTIYLDDAVAVPSLVDDAAEQPNAWYGNGVTPDGVRWRNTKYPGLQQGPVPAYPMAGGVSFGLGTTNADTITGGGITVLYYKLREESYLPFTIEDIGVYTADFVAAVKRLQADVHLTVTGTMTTATWNRLWDIDATGWSLNGAKIFPLLEDPAVRQLNYSANGSVVDINDAYDRRILRVERDVDFGGGETKQDAADWFRGQQARSAGKNWTGTIRLNGFGVISGEHNPGDTALTDNDARIMSYEDVRPGWNAWLPQFDGGTLVHIAGVDVDADGATLTVDTQARDLLDVAAVLARNADARRDVRREWIAANRPRKGSGAMIPRDEFFGRLWQNVDLSGNAWNLVPVVVGQQGQINRVNIVTTSSAAAFAVAVFSKHVGKKELKRRIGNPLAAVADGADAWYEKDSNNDLFDNRILLYAAGTNEQPCGYWPRKHTNDRGVTTSAAITGKWRDDANFAYIMDPYSPAVIWVAIYPDRDCTLKAGQMFWAQEDDVT